MKQREPSISIIIPSYNRADFLQKNIPELLTLEYDNYEIIVVDDGSTDHTADVFNNIKDPKLKYYKKQNEERAAARNYGAERAIGEYITFLDSDDMLYPDALKKAAAAINEKGFPDFLHLGFEIGTNDHVDTVVNGLKDNDPLILVIGNPLSCMGIFVKREIFKIQHFNPDRQLAGSEDWELWMRLAANYGLRTDNRIVGRLIQHDARSVMGYPEKRLVERATLAMKYAFADAAVQKIYGPYKKKIQAHWYTYIALHLAMEGKKKRVLHYVQQAVKNSFGSMCTKRGLVIIKLLLLQKSVD